MTFVFYFDWLIIRDFYVNLQTDKSKFSMKLIKIQSSKDPLIAQVPELYESAFSEAERTDTERFLWMIDHCQEMSFYAITEDDDFCGMAVVFELGICRYLLYLATLDIHRNKGLGALTLKLLREETNLPIIGEMEPPTDDITRRRIAFYERNGFHVELEDPRILNDAHLDPSCVLMLISTHPLSDADECQRRVVETIYKPMQAEEV